MDIGCFLVIFYKYCTVMLFSRWHLRCWCRSLYRWSDRAFIFFFLLKRLYNPFVLWRVYLLFTAIPSLFTLVIAKVGFKKICCYLSLLLQSEKGDSLFLFKYVGFVYGGERINCARLQVVLKIIL